MGGPAAEVVFGRAPDERDRAALDALLGELGEHVQLAGGGSDYELETTLPIAGTYHGEGRPVAVSWNVGERYPGEELDFHQRDEILARSFGLLPVSRIGVSVHMGREQDHRILGELVYHLAKRFGGIIDLCGALMPASTWTNEESGRLLEVLEATDWQEVSGPREEFFRTMPGRIVAIPYETVNGHTWVTHVCDSEFMAAWLRHPDFHMIK